MLAKKKLTIFLLAFILVSLSFFSVPFVQATPQTETFYITEGVNDGYISSMDVDYNTAQTMGTSSNDNDNEIWFGQQFVAGMFFGILRSFLKFNTSIIPSNAVIVSANLSLNKHADYSITDFIVKLQKWVGDTPITLSDFTEFDGISYDDGNFDTSNFSSWNTITVSNFSLIKKAGYTKICVRSNRDVEQIEPSEFEYVGVHSYEEGSTKRPKLTVSWKTWCTVTFRNNTGGIFRVDNATLSNGTSKGFWSGTVLEFCALPENSSVVFSMFEWNSQNVTTNPHNFTVSSNASVWCVFEESPKSRLAVGLLFGLIIGLVIGLIIALGVSKH